MSKVSRVTGDNSPINFRVSFKDSGPVDLSSHTPQITIEKDDGTAIVTAATTGLTVQPSQTFTADASTDLLTCYEHGAKDADQVLLTTTGTLPAPLATATRYFIVQRSDIAFGLASTPGGAQINLTDAGSGTHGFKIVGSGQYAPQSTYAVGLYRCWILLADATTTILPESEYGFELEVKAMGN